MMDTVLNLGLNDADARRASSRRPATRASPTTPTAASSTCSARSCWTSTAEKFEHDPAGREAEGAASSSTPTWPPSDLKEVVERYKELVKQRDGQAVPDRPARAAPARDRGRLPLLEQRARHRSTATSTRSRTTSARPSTCRRWSSATWATTRGTGVAFTRDPTTGESELLRRVPAQRPGRGRRRRHPHAAADRAARATSCPRSTSSSQQIAEQLEQHYKDMQDLEFTVERRQAVHAPDPHRQAHRPRRRCGSPSRWSNEGLIDAGGRPSSASSPGRLEPAAAPADRPERRKAERRSRQGLNAVARARRSARSSSTAERRRGAGPRHGETRHPGPPGDHPEDVARHARGPGHPDRPRRHDQPRRRRRPRDGQAVRRRLRGAARSTTRRGQFTRRRRRPSRRAT